MTMIVESTLAPHNNNYDNIIMLARTNYFGIVAHRFSIIESRV